MRSLQARTAVLTALLMTTAFLAPATGGAGASTFDDVGTDHPFGVAIDWAVVSSITSGYGDGTFRPTDAVTRQAFAAFLWRYANEGADKPLCATDDPFPDVTTNHPFCGEITWLVETEITTGYDDDTFRPTAPISRQAMAAFLWRYANEGADKPLCATEDPFPDVTTNHPFCGEITWLVETEITTGYDDDTFRPTAPISRQAAVAFLWRYEGRPIATIELASFAHDGSSPSDNVSSIPSISDDGRFVTFSSSATNLVPDDTNGRADAFVYDRLTGQVTRVSVASDGTQSDGSSVDPAISGDGRFVTFESTATNLVPDDTNAATDVFVHDRLTRETTRVSVSSEGTEGDANSIGAALSRNGRHVVFHSRATNLVPDDTNAATDVFVHDRLTGETTRVSVSSEGTEGDAYSYYASISADGRHVAFDSAATNLVPDDTNDNPDAFVHDRLTGETRRVSVSSEGAEAAGGAQEPRISSDGGHVTFWSEGPELVDDKTTSHADVFVHDLATAETQRISVDSDGAEADGDSYTAHASDGGRYIAFDSDATNLVPGDVNEQTDVFLHDRVTGQTVLVSVADDGTRGDDWSFFPRITPSGRHVVFWSRATTLVPVGNPWQDAVVSTRFGVG